MVNFTLQLLYPLGKEPAVTFGKEAEWTLDKVWKLWRRENS
jgi:hypothetical protein